MRHSKQLLIGSLLTALTAVQQVRAIPVTDIGAITQLVTQIEYWKQQIQGMTDQLTQLQNSYQSMTGQRGLQNLLPISPQLRNYLPGDWRELDAAITGLVRGGGAFSGQVESVIRSNAILTADRLLGLAPEVRRQFETERRAVALRQVVSRTALTNASGRFSAIQQLVAAIANTADQKAVLELQARIQAELGMLQNEQTKLQILQQLALTEEAAERQREWESGIVGQGRFASRFQPRPR